MRILIVTNKPPYPLVDGGCIATYNLLDAYAKAGHSVSVLSFSTSKHIGDLKQIPHHITSVIDFHFVDVDTELSPLAALNNLVFSRLPYNAQRFINVNFRTKLISLLKEQTYDIVQLEGLYLCPYIDTVRQHSKARLVYRSHNIESEIWSRSAQNEAALLKRSYLKILAKRILRFEKSFINKYDLLLPITQRDADAFTQLGNTAPMLVAPAGYNVEKWQPYLGDDAYPHLFHLGALDWMPNQEGLLWFLDNVWSQIVRERPEIKFFIAGRNAPQSFASTVSAYAGVVYVGEVPDAVSFIHSQGIMIVPLHSGGGMRVKIIEGMALGKTIVTTPIGAEGISATHGENIIIAESKYNFFAEICSLINNRSYCRSIGENARRFIKDNYDNGVIAAHVLHFYEGYL